MGWVDGCGGFPQSTNIKPEATQGRQHQQIIWPHEFSDRAEPLARVVDMLKELETREERTSRRQLRRLDFF